MSRPAWFAALLIGLSLAGATTSTAAAQEKVRLVASFTILADMAREIGGERLQVDTLVGPDGDAHVFQPTPAHARAVAQADILLVNGLGFEGWIDRLQRSSGFKGLLVVASAGITPITMADDHDHGHGHGHSPGASSTRKKARPAAAISDPHAWQDLANGRAYVDNIARGLAAADPPGAGYYAQRAGAYKQRLSDLDTRVRAAFDAIPAKKRRAITSHDAFGYFGRAYGIEFIPATGASTESEPTARQIAALIAQIRKEKIKALFVENMSNPRLIEQLGRDAGVTPGGALYSDSLSPPGGPADTYLKMFELNATTLQAGMARN